MVYVVGMFFLFGTSAMAVDKTAAPGTTASQIIGDSGKTEAVKAEGVKTDTEDRS